MRVGAILLACCLAASARAITIHDPFGPPPGLAPGSVYQRVFVTDDSYNISADSSYPPSGSTVAGLAGGDFQVNLSAYQAGQILGSDWIKDWDGDAILFHANALSSQRHGMNEQTL